MCRSWPRASTPWSSLRSTSSATRAVRRRAAQPRDRLRRATGRAASPGMRRPKTRCRRRPPGTARHRRRWHPPGPTLELVRRAPTPGAEQPLECGGDAHVALLREPLTIRQPAACAEGGGASLAFCATSAKFPKRRSRLKRAPNAAFQAATSPPRREETHQNSKPQSSSAPEWSCWSRVGRRATNAVARPSPTRRCLRAAAAVRRAVANVRSASGARSTRTALKLKDVRPARLGTLVPCRAVSLHRLGNRNTDYRRNPDWR
jgi:hypothetical protein